MTIPSPLSRRRRAIVVVVAVAVVAAGGGWWASTRVTSPTQAAAEAAPPAPSVLTAPVEKRVIQDTIVGRGTVAPARSVDVRLRASSTSTGDAVITAVDVARGDEVAAGDVLVEVSGRPVIAIPGEIPVYRDLVPGDSGEDVRQLQTALTALGFPVTVDGSYGAGTSQAVTALYRAKGFEPSPASPDDADKLKTAQAQVTAAQRGVEDARDAADEAQRAAVAANTPGAAGGSGAAGASGEATSGPDAAAAAAATAAASRAQRSLDRAVEDLQTAKDDLRAVTAATGASFPASEFIALPTFPALVRQVNVTVGGAIPEVALSLSTGDLQVTAPLEAQMTGLVREGQAVALTSEVLGRDATGTVTVVDTAAAAATTATAAPTSDVGPHFIVTPDVPLPAEWNGQDVRVTIVAAASAGEVLVVPLSAVSADAQERTRVTVVGPDGQQTRVEVTTGVVGGGYVQITPVAGGDAAALVTAGATVVIGVTAGSP